MKHSIAVAGIVAAASLFASAAYAGSPYYDVDGQMAPQPVIRGHVKPSAMRRSPVASVVPKASGSAAADVGSDGFAKPAADSEAFDHAVGTDGSTVASTEPSTEPKTAPIYTAPMPKMDADGFEHAEGDKSLYEHAVGTDGSQVTSDAAPAAPQAAPVYTAAMPKMDSDGFEHREGERSFYDHVVGTMGSP